MKLSRKVPLIAVLLCACSFAMIGVLGYVQARNGLTQSAIERLTLVSETKRDSLKRVMESNSKILGALAGSETTRQGMKWFETVFANEDHPTIRSVYQPQNATPEQRAKLTGEGSRDLYTFRHAGVHSSFLGGWENGDYTDAYIILANGSILYTLTKGEEFFKKISDFNGTPLARVFERAMALKAGQQAFEDFSAYAAPDGAASAFWAEPIYPSFVEADTKPDGVLVLRMSARNLDAILGGAEADGTRQDNFLIGADGRLRSNREAIQAKALGTGLSEQVLRRISGEKAGYVGIPADSAGGQERIAAYQQLPLQAATYYVIAAQSEERALAAVSSMRNSMLLLSFAALAVFAAISVYLGTLLTNPIKALAETVQRLAQNELNIGVPGLTRKDELADIARAVEVFKERAKENEQLRLQIDAERVENDRRRAEQDKLLEDAIGRVVSSAAAGDFSQRIDASSLGGVAATLGNGINSLLDDTGKSLSGINIFLDAMAHGDLSRRMEGNYRGVFANLQGNANQTAERLSDIVRQIAGTAGNVKEASAEISGGSQDLAARTEQQAASLEETAASMHEITATVKQNAGSAEMASRLAEAARGTADQGGAVAQDAVRAMAEIEGAAQKISDIVGLIDEIAFQTNLLALNASVEAARAGEAGKGFAVVAQEVRGLAQRSANASRDIKTLIQTSNAKVRGGSELVQKAGGALEEIMMSVKKVADIVVEISAASGEQATGLEEVSRAVTNMDEMTQRNGALVEQTTASAQALAAQADQLHQLVAQFRV